MEEETADLTVETLADPTAAVASAMALGSIALAALKKYDCVTFYISVDGKVEFCPPWEIALDAADTDTALRALLERDYTDEQLESYLKGRAARRMAVEKNS